MDTRPREQILTLIAIALTLGSGAMDVVALTRLGSVFASVMTGNLVLTGLAVARGSVSLASHTVVSVAGYVAGVAGGTLITHGVKAGEAERESRDKVVSAPVSRTLLVQLILLAAFAALWEVSEPRPAGAAQFCLLAVAAAAMGMQSSAVNDMGLAHVSTTYLTGTLTGLVSSLVKPGQGTSYRVRRFGVLFALLTGATLNGLLVASAAPAVPILPLAALVTALVLAAVPVDADRTAKSPS